MRTNGESRLMRTIEIVCICKAVKRTTMTELEEHHVRVFLRLRPLNRLEVNRRSRSVVEILDDQRVAVEDPAEGDWEVTCDKVSTRTKQIVPI
jgi:hypothetical protein